MSSQSLGEANCVRRQSADQWRHSVAAPGVRLARRWHYMDVYWRVTIAQAHHSNLRRMLDCPPSRSLFQQNGSTDPTVFDPPRVFSVSLASSCRRSLHLSQLRSASFSSLFLFSRFSQLPPAYPLLSRSFLFPYPTKNFSFPATRTNGVPSPSISHSLLYTPSLSRIRFCHFIPYLPFYPASSIPTSSLPFDHNSHLTNIVSTLALSKETSASRRAP